MHPRCVRDRAEDLEEVRAMIEAGELEIALDELRWLLADCREFIAAHVLLGELAVATQGDLPLARGHFGAGYQLGSADAAAGQNAEAAAVFAAGEPAVFRSRPRTGLVVWKNSASATMAEEVVDDARRARSVRSACSCGRCSMSCEPAGHRWLICRWNFRTGSMAAVSEPRRSPMCEQGLSREVSETRTSTRLRRPAREDAAGQSAAVGGFQKQLAGCGRLAAVAEDAFGQIGGQFGRADAGRVAGHEHECAVLGRQLAAQSQERQQVFVRFSTARPSDRGRSWAGRGSRRRIGCRASARAGRTSSRLR